MTQSGLYSHQEAARYLNVKVQTLYNWRHQRRGPDYVMIGSKPMYLRQDLDTYVEKHRVILNS